MNYSNSLFFAASYILAKPKTDCGEPGQSLVETEKECEDAVHDINWDYNLAKQKIRVEKPSKSIPKGCYLYVPSKEVYFNAHESGLSKELWSKDTRQVCHFSDQGNMFWLI